MGASNQAGKAEAGITTPSVTESLRGLWQELISVTRRLAELDLNEDQSAEILIIGQQRQVELREQIDNIKSEANVSLHVDLVQECLDLERQFQMHLVDARERYRQPLSNLQQANQLRRVYTNFQQSDGIFVDRSQ
ncbi:hypothetical protein SD71_06800 [Cohnella kolymensis]|uniref:Flagellar protein FliT n=1 Tax=Cohnella kolymensis TaxID=1590652 RepID=A0ABR5A8F7_9BACL|nr:hypothetical protein [Cohnella kolymensis]KIL36702.1 hypothetical protein SD71_06800 [Cohnella kolymensis]